MLQKTSLISGVDHWLHALCCVVTGQNTSERRSNRPFRASYRGEIDHVKGWIYGGYFFLFLSSWKTSGRTNFSGVNIVLFNATLLYVIEIRSWTCNGLVYVDYRS